MYLFKEVKIIEQFLAWSPESSNSSRSLELAKGSYARKGNSAKAWAGWSHNNIDNTVSQTCAFKREERKQYPTLYLTSHHGVCTKTQKLNQNTIIKPNLFHPLLKVTPEWEAHIPSGQLPPASRHLLFRELGTPLFFLPQRGNFLS